MTDNQTAKCKNCDGTGCADYAGFAMDTCETCAGTGKIQTTSDDIEEAQMLAQEYILCDDEKLTDDAKSFKLRLIRAIIDEVRKDD